MKNFELNKAIQAKQERLNSEKIEMNYKRFDKDLPALFRESNENAGFDLFARLDEPVTIQPGEVAKIPLNVATEIPILAVGLLFQRSSTFAKWGVRLTNNVGVIDCSFRGDDDEWAAEFQNMTDKPVTIKRGDKVCQAVFLPILDLIPREKDHLGNANRGGFGTSFDNASELDK